MIDIYISFFGTSQDILLVYNNFFIVFNYNNENYTIN